jgi:hypothetical protein
MQQILNVAVKASSYDLTTLAEMKSMLMIASADTSHDALLTQLITDISETIATMCNRVFGYEEVNELFSQLSDGTSQRLYLSRWPVVFGDIKTFTSDGADQLVDYKVTWILEEDSGTLYMDPQYGQWDGVILVDYSGGYKLPTDAPGSLKFAAQAIIRESYMGWIRNPALYGMRQISHKESRIAYYQPNLLTSMGSPESWKNVQSILDKYIRQWV